MDFEQIIWWVDRIALGIALAIVAMVLWFL